MAYDVVVVGGGPVGSQVAYRLVSPGCSVAVLEEKTEPVQTVCCTGIVSEECLREFDIDESVVFRHYRSASIHSPSGKTIRLERDSPQAAILNRPAFNAFMAGRAHYRGAAYALGARVIDVDIGHDKALVTAMIAEKTTQFETKAVVLATGSNATLTKKLGMGTAGNFVGGAQAEVDVKGITEVEVYFGRDVAPDFFAWLAPTTPDKALAGLITRHDPRGHLAAFLDTLKKKGRIRTSTSRVTSAALPLKPIAKSCTNRLLIAGTAAGLVKPTTGGGIYYGLLSADIAADVLREALARGDVSSRSLSVYQSRWKKKLGHELRVGSWGRTFFEKLNDAQLDRAFDIVGRPGTIERLLGADGVSFDWHGNAIVHLLAERTLTKLIEGIEMPFRGRNTPRNDLSQEETPIDRRSR